jgi:prepilin-type N-terminal cleavage/methylation domain-containing protein
MRGTPNGNRQRGFSFVELLVALALISVICGAVFGLLNVSQERFRSESQVLSAFQEARLGLDQIVRDVNDAGFPPRDTFSILPGANKYAYSPIAWNPSYPATPCTIAGSCVTPGDFDLIIETDIDPQNNNGVEWVRYQLQGTTLFRGVVSKPAAPGADPAATTAAAGVMIPYIQNVMNNAPAAQIAQFKAAYPVMFPGGAPVPIFRYTCDTTTGPQLCTAAGAFNSAANIRDVEITLIVMAPQVDIQTRAPLLVELDGRGHRVNPNK